MTGGRERGGERLPLRAAAGVALAYASLAFIDAIGVLQERLRLEGVASSLVFLWFALVPLPAGALCRRLGAGRVAVSALLAMLPALALLFAGGGFVPAAAGLALAGVSNVVLQVALPVRVAEAFGVARQASVMTLGLFVKMLVAGALPLALAFFAAAGDWRLFFVPVGVVCASAAAFLRGGVADAAARGGASFRAVWRSLRDAPTAFCAAAFAAGVVADVAFNVSVPAAVRDRFGMGEAAAGAVYALLFGVKLPAVLAGAWLFAKGRADRLFVPSTLLSFVGSLAMLLAGGFAAYLAGVALFAAGCANVYGFVFGIASPRHGAGGAPAVAALLAMSVSAGAAASPLVAAVRPLGPLGPGSLVSAAALALLAFAQAAVRAGKGGA